MAENDNKSKTGDVTAKSVSPAKESAKGTKTKKSKAKDKKPGFWTGVKREWKKIIWTPRNEVGRKTALTIVISLIMGIIITVIDSGAQYIVEWLMKI